MGEVVVEVSGNQPAVDQFAFVVWIDCGVLKMNDQILENYQIRKSNKEKTAFIGYLKERLSASGYDPERDITVEEKWKGIFRTRNIIVGDPDKAKVLLTAMQQ